MLRAENPLLDGRQRGELVAGPGCVPRLPGPAGEVAAGGQGVRVLRAEDLLEYRQLRGVLAAGPGRCPGRVQVWRRLRPARFREACMAFRAR